ncbi:MAG: membrane protein insertion efficiency factor YidD [Chlamydiae bacterium]|nr:membrane protein insertion efficiency factor YidD [Chlamydiota bacterium]
MIKNILIALIKGYQMTISPFLGSCCKFYPSCSEYGIQAFRKHPIHKAAWMTAKRICRCGPWTQGGIDPVP